MVWKMKAPDWIMSIVRAASKANCLIVNFDRDADADPAFPVYAR